MWQRGESSHTGGEGEGPAHGKIQKISCELLGEGFRGAVNMWSFLAENEGRSLMGFLVESF